MACGLPVSVFRLASCQVNVNPSSPQGLFVKFISAHSASHFLSYIPYSERVAVVVVVVLFWNTEVSGVLTWPLITGVFDSRCNISLISTVIKL